MKIKFKPNVGAPLVMNDDLELGNFGPYRGGEVVNLPDSVASYYVDGGYAEVEEPHKSSSGVRLP